jgi:ribosomal-protein-alanine N-acetyltransferase
MKSPDEAIKRIAGLADEFQAQEGVRWAITDRATGQYLGNAGFWRLVKPHFRAEIGYVLTPERWGQGVMPEALGAILQFGFETIGLHTVEANIDPDNTSSRRVLEKLGFIREGYLRESYYEPEQARFTDTALYSLLASDWASRAQA